MKVFIPNIYREKKVFDKLYDEIPTIDSLSRNENRIKKGAIVAERQKDFNSIFINEIEYFDLDFLFHINEDKMRGYFVYIPTNQFKLGKNILTIKKKYFDEDGNPKIVKIPFMFEGL